MRRFLWAGMPSDIQSVLEGSLAAQEVRLVLPETEEGKVVFFDEAGSAFWKTVSRFSRVLIAGNFTVDIQLSPERLFVIEYSGPLLYLRMPSVFVDGTVWNSPKNPKAHVELKEGYLGIHGTYYFKHPKDRDPTAEAEAAYKNLIKVAKKSLVKHEGRWVGKTAKEWLESKKASYRKE